MDSIQSQQQNAPHHSRHRSLGERFPGDMSHRPLDIIKRDARAAERPRRHRRTVSETDIIDSLDTIGGTYHHGGPYDATLRSRNLDERYSPVAAVRDSLMEAIRATPREYIVDCLERHVPLQGTATIPSGGYDLSGNVMHYEEGADLMREPDAKGGPYKRWSGVSYDPNDLKGKGEPSYTFEKALKEKKRASRNESAEIEMQSGILTRRRSRFMSSSKQNSDPTPTPAPAPAPAAAVPESMAAGTDMNRRNSAGKKLSDGLKRRFVGLRRKVAPTGQVH